MNDEQTRRALVEAVLKQLGETSDTAFVASQGSTFRALLMAIQDTGNILSLHLGVSGSEVYQALFDVLPTSFGFAVADMEQQSPDQPITFEDRLLIFCAIARKMYRAGLGAQERKQAATEQGAEALLYTPPATPYKM